MGEAAGRTVLNRCPPFAFFPVVIGRMGAKANEAMRASRTCGRCGTVVPVDAPDDLCLVCLLDTAVGFDGIPGGLMDLAAGTADSVPSSTPPPTFGAYTLLGELGRGGQGVVYRARHRDLGRLVALKTIPKTRLGDARLRERFRLEASAASRLDHPNLVPIYEAGEQDGFCYYSMKLIEGETLQSRGAQSLRLAGGERRVASVMLKVAHAVHHAHQRGVLHRDLKPSNILLDREDEPHVADFGLAHLADDEAALTLSQALIGTPAYLAPEVAKGGSRQATIASDVYGLGAVLYQLLTGKPPFAKASVVETLRAVHDDETVAPSQLNARVPADLETICLKCLEKEPAKRYAAAQELAHELDRFLKDEPILARPVSRTERAWRWCRRKPALAGALGASLLLLFAVLIGFPVAIHHIQEARRRADREAHRARQGEYASDMRMSIQALSTGNPGRAWSLVEKHRPALGAPDGSSQSPMPTSSVPPRRSSAVEWTR